MCSNGLADGCEPRLNFDVLRSICNDLTEVPDVLSFALTCSALGKGALQRRLGMSPVVLSLPDSVERLHNFISVDPTSRAPYLYGLRLYSDCDYAPNGDPRFINDLVAIMEAATRLEYLYLPTILGRSVCTVVAKMGMLRELVVVSDTSAHAQHEPEALNWLLTALRSPLKYLTITAHEMEQISTSFLHDDLHYFAPTLEYLALDYLHFNMHPSSVTTPFTAMRSLRIVSTFLYQFYQMDVLLRLFPNLDDTLFLKGCRPPVDQYPTLREQSKAAQRDRTWSGLDRVACSAEVAFLMALRCPIRRMDIIEPMQNEALYLAEALRDSCPRHLLLPIAFSRHNHLQSLHGLFPREATDKLSHLVLFAEISVYQHRRRQTGERDCFSWVQFLDCLVDSLKHLRLTHLRIVFYYDIFPPDPDPAQRDVACARDEGFAENVAHDADLHPAAIRLLDAVQTLQYLFLTTCGVRRYGEPWKYWHSSRAWRRVVGVDDEDPRLPASVAKTPRGSCVEIQVTEQIDGVEAVIDEEELYLGRTEERMARHCMESASK